MSELEQYAGCDGLLIQGKLWYHYEKMKRIYPRKFSWD